MAVVTTLMRIAEYLSAGRIDILWYRWLSYWHALDLSFVSQEALGVSPAIANWCSNSGGPDLANVLRAVLPDSRAIDLGCGKGGAVITLSPFFREVVGVDLAPSLIPIAEANARRAGVRNVTFICADARDVNLDPFSLVYLYNPFPEDVLAVVLSNLTASLARHPRDLTVVYKHPACHQRVLATGLFSDWSKLSFRMGGHPFGIYRHRLTPIISSAPESGLASLVASDAR